MLRIDLAPLREGVHHLELQAEAQEIELDPDTFADIRVAVVLDYRNERALVTLQASAVATLECDRTLVLFEQPVGGTFQMLFVPPTFARRGDAEDEQAEEIHVLDPSEHEIDLSEVVRDTLLLAIPARKVAPSAEEKEIPTRFGVASETDETYVDPRWEALRSLRTGNSDTDA